MSVCDDFLPSLDGLFNNLIDVRQVTSFVVIVETVSYDEIVFDIEATVVNLEVYLQATRLDEERSDEYFLRLLFAQHAEHFLHGSTRFDDVFYDDYGTDRKSTRLNSSHCL